MLNAIKTEKFIRILHKMGFKEMRQRGSHKFFEHADGRTTVVPYHSEIHEGLLTKIVKHDLKMKREEFMKFI